VEVKEIVNLLQRKEQRGLQLLMDNYSGALNGVIVRIVGSQLVAEEILQNTFLKVWNNVDSYDNSKGTFYTWIHRIARNSALDKARTKGFNLHEKSNEIDDTVYKEGGHTDLAGIDVKKLLNNIDVKYKEVLDHIYLQGYSQSEAAEKLNIPLGTVKTRIRYAVNELRGQLKNEKKLFLGLFAVLILLMIALWM